MNASASFAASPNFCSDLEPIVELNFPVRGTSLPADHNYGLYAAFIQIIPELRSLDKISILTVPGFGDRKGKILLTEQSCLKLRVPASQIPLVYQLAGKQVFIGRHAIQIGIPQTSMIRPAAKLKSRIVTIKGYTEPQTFLSAAQRQFNNLGISGEIAVAIDRDGKPSRKTIKIQRYTIVGFTTEVSGLSDESSLKLQECGLGGKRHMGCGIFVPLP